MVGQLGSADVEHGYPNHDGKYERRPAQNRGD